VNSIYYANLEFFYIIVIFQVVIYLLWFKASCSAVQATPDLVSDVAATALSG
jgi:hypothetical protein